MHVVDKNYSEVELQGSEIAAASSLARTNVQEIQLVAFKIWQHLDIIGRAN